ncbi:hypothetical protein GCM10019016_111560 [Streptomyces prasinosporus]|uniref:Uncharacterized protein n=1 Tax=Streptomyces prasinosporus TaxID=68256 RepID=A0ABP6UBH5_9ACTN
MSARVPTPRDRPARPDQAAQALGVVQFVVQQGLGDRALGEVVDPLPAAALDAHHLAVHQRALDGDLGAGPVPPVAGALGAAQFRGRERALRAELLDHLVVGAVGELVVPHRPGAVGAAAEGEVGPLLDGEDARGVRPVLERVRRPGTRLPVRVLDGRAAHGAQTGVGDELVGAGQDRDRVELHRAQVAEDPPDAGAAVGGAEEALGPQGDAAGLVRREFRDRARKGRHVPAR